MFFCIHIYFLILNYSVRINYSLHFIYFHFYSHYFLLRSNLCRHHRFHAKWFHNFSTFVIYLLFLIASYRRINGLPSLVFILFVCADAALFFQLLFSCLWLEAIGNILFYVLCYWIVLFACYQTGLPCKATFVILRLQLC